MRFLGAIIEGLLNAFFFEIVEWVQTSSVGRIVFWTLLLIGVSAGVWALGRAMHWW